MSDEKCDNEKMQEPPKEVCRSPQDNEATLFCSRTVRTGSRLNSIIEQLRGSHTDLHWDKETRDVPAEESQKEVVLPQDSISVKEIASKFDIAVESASIFDTEPSENQHYYVTRHSSFYHANKSKPSSFIYGQHSMKARLPRLKESSIPSTDDVRMLEETAYRTSSQVDEVGLLDDPEDKAASTPKDDTVAQTSSTVDKVGMLDYHAEGTFSTPDKKGMLVDTEEQTSFTSDEVGMVNEHGEQTSSTVDEVLQQHTGQTSSTQNEVRMLDDPEEQTYSTVDKVGMPDAPEEQTASTPKEVSLLDYPEEQTFSAVDEVGMLDAPEEQTCSIPHALDILDDTEGVATVDDSRQPEYLEKAPGEQIEVLNATGVSDVNDSFESKSNSEMGASPSVNKCELHAVSSMDEHIYANISMLLSPNSTRESDHQDVVEQSSEAKGKNCYYSVAPCSSDKDAEYRNENPYVNDSSPSEHYILMSPSMKKTSSSSNQKSGSFQQIILEEDLDNIYEEFDPSPSTTQNDQSIQWDDSFSSFSSDEGAFVSGREGDMDSAQSTPKSQLEHAATEMMETEKTYVTQLIILERMLAGLEISTMPVERRSRAVNIFKEVKPLRMLHKLLYDLFEGVVKSGDYAGIARVFLREDVKNFLKIYRTFLRHYEINYQIMHRLYAEEPEFKSCCERVMKNAEFPLMDLPGIYQAVCARIVRYQLTLKEISKHVPSESPEKTQTEDALDMLSEIIQSSESELCKSTEFSSTLKVHYLLEGRQRDLSNTSRFITRGSVTKVSRRTGVKLQERYMVLFSDCLVITMPQNSFGKFRVRKEISVFSILLKEIEEEERTVQHCFRVQAAEDCIDLAFQSDVEKQEWWTAIEVAIKADIEEKKKVEPNRVTSIVRAAVWVKDEQVSMCMLCARRFDVRRRRHHCRACGLIVCKVCSSYKLHLEYPSSKGKARVCKTCYEKNSCNEKPEDSTTYEVPRSKSKRYPAPKRYSGDLVVRHKVSDSTWGTGKRLFCCVREDCCLSAYARKKDIQTLFKIVPLGYAIIDGETLDHADVRGFILEHTNPNLSYYLQAPSVEQKTRWIAALNDVIAKVLE